MTFEEAIRRAIKSYYDKADFANYEKASGKPIKYKKDYFDTVESELLTVEEEVEIEANPEEEVLEDEAE